jgi:hypothetical protein
MENIVWTLKSKKALFTYEDTIYYESSIMRRQFPSLSSVFKFILCAPKKIHLASYNAGPKIIPLKLCRDGPLITANLLITFVQTTPSQLIDMYRGALFDPIFSISIGEGFLFLQFFECFFTKNYSSWSPKSFVPGKFNFWLFEFKIFFTLLKKWKIEGAWDKTFFGEFISSRDHQICLSKLVPFQAVWVWR